MTVYYALPVLLAFPDTAFDFASLTYNIYTGNYAAARWDAASLMIPGVTGLGALSHADEAYDAYRWIGTADDLRYSYIRSDRAFSAFNASKHADEFITFYHGTNLERAENIRRIGIDPKYFQPDKDFGFAFYTTIDKAQAGKWASWWGEDAAILEFRIPRSEFEALSGYSFRDTSKNWIDFVKRNRQGMPLGTRYVNYDYISGTMLLNPRQFLPPGTEALIAGGQQIAFYTQRSFDILRKGLRP